MKVSVITRHAVTNYGSFLHAYATQIVIEQLGHECEIIDYIRPDENYKSIEKTILKHKPKWNSSLLKRIIYLIMRQPESIIAGKRFERYRNEYLHLTPRYTSVQEVRENIPDADCYITGSDQVWGPIGTGKYDECYFLSFTKENDYRFSYAASFGRTKESPDIEKYLRDQLIKYHCILVREDSAVSRIKEMGLQAAQVIDPTMLLDKGFWRSKATGKLREKYILIYQLHNNPRLGRFAKELAIMKGVKLIRVSVSLHQMVREGSFIYCPDPFKFLFLIDNAECLITDSFHGTAFAINLNTPFIEILPDNGTRTRNVNILQMTGLSDRILKEEDDYTLADRKIDFCMVNEILENERENSKEKLSNMLRMAVGGK